MIQTSDVKFCEVCRSTTDVRWNGMTDGMWLCRTHKDVGGLPPQCTEPGCKIESLHQHAYGDRSQWFSSNPSRWAYKSPETRAEEAWQAHSKTKNDQITKAAFIAGYKAALS